VLVNIANAG